MSVDHTGGPSPSGDIPLSTAIGTWAAAWTLGSIVVAPIVVLATGGSVGSDLGVGRLALVAATGWAVFGVGLVLASRRAGSGGFTADFALRFRALDLIGLPVGLLGQFVVVPGLYVPLRAAWPDTFDPGRVSERAEELVAGASGVEVVVLVVVVAIGAPVVEELVYRGLLQRSAASVLGPWPALLITSVLFSIIHFSPVEYPGLFVAGLLFGACLTLTGRLGPAVVAHAAFNAAGLYAVLT